MSSQDLVGPVPRWDLERKKTLVKIVCEYSDGSAVELCNEEAHQWSEWINDAVRNDQVHGRTTIRPPVKWTPTKQASQ